MWHQQVVNHPSGSIALRSYPTTYHQPFALAYHHPYTNTKPRPSGAPHIPTSAHPTTQCDEPWGWLQEDSAEQSSRATTSSPKSSSPTNTKQTRRHNARMPDEPSRASEGTTPQSPWCCQHPAHRQHHHPSMSTPMDLYKALGHKNSAWEQQQPGGQAEPTTQSPMQKLMLQS